SENGSSVWNVRPERGACHWLAMKSPKRRTRPPELELAAGRTGCEPRYDARRPCQELLGRWRFCLLRELERHAQSTLRSLLEQPMGDHEVAHGHALNHAQNNVAVGGATWLQPGRHLADIGIDALSQLGLGQLAAPHPTRQR